MAIRKIPLIHMDDSDAHALMWQSWPEVRALMASAMTTHPVFPLAVALGDPVSRRWLRRRDNPYYGEIARIASDVARRGGWFFNIVYEWGCSTSVAPDPEGPGARMIRVLDWELRGMAHFTQIAEQAGPAGRFYNITWPGYAGVVTGMAPGRFAAAINQGPRATEYHSFWLNEIVARWRMLIAPRNAIPATHLLRRTFEQAPDFESAVAMLMDTARPVATPALFIVSGVERGEGAVIEALGDKRRRHDMTKDAPLGVANAWLSPELHGTPLPPAKEWAGAVNAREDSARRRALVCALQGRPFVGAASLAPPVLNSRTVLVAGLNAASGRAHIEALDSPAPGTLPHVVGRRILQ
jgi:hypothetical protein